MGQSPEVVTVESNIRSAANGGYKAATAVLSGESPETLAEAYGVELATTAARAVSDLDEWSLTGPDGGLLTSHVRHADTFDVSTVAEANADLLRFAESWADEHVNGPSTTAVALLFADCLAGSIADAHVDEVGSLRFLNEMQDVAGFDGMNHGEPVVGIETSETFQLKGFRLMYSGDDSPTYPVAPKESNLRALDEYDTVSGNVAWMGARFDGVKGLFWAPCDEGIAYCASYNALMAYVADEVGMSVTDLNTASNLGPIWAR